MQPKNIPIRVLMIDDDSKLQSLLSEFLPLYKIKLLSAFNAESGIKIIKSKAPDIIVLDVMMPGMDGFEACKEIRKFSDTPIIMLSARGEAMDKIVGLELGADDYMSKPFEPRELVTRIQVIIKRSYKNFTPKTLKFKDLEINLLEREAYLLGEPILLTTMEYELLLYLAQSPGKKFNRDELMIHIQGFESDNFSRSIDVLISRLRSKLGEVVKNPRFIKSVHGYGYVFTGDKL